MADTPAIEEIFTKIQEEYGWETAVTKFMMAKDGLHAQKLDDFLKMVTCEGDIAGVMEQIKDVSNRLQQTSRVRQAWVALVKADKMDEENKKRRLDSTDMDELLTQQLTILG